MLKMELALMLEQKDFGEIDTKVHFFDVRVFNLLHQAIVVSP